MKMRSFFLGVLFVSLIVLGMAASANAGLVTIDLSTPTFAWGDDSSQNLIDAAIALISPPLTEYYKATPVGEPPSVTGSTEVGTLAGSYQTAYLPPGDKENATISYQGGFYISSTAYLLAKDGKANDTDPATHAWYLYNLTNLGWTGTELITITDLWPNQGSFSHVALYGSSISTNVVPPVPEPGTLLLLGFGLVGLAGARRRLMK